MGMAIRTKNAFSVISDPDSFNPDWNHADLKRCEVFTYSGIGGNMMIGESRSTAIASPTLVDGTPFAEFTSYGATVPHLRLAMTDGELQTWILLFDPNNSTLQRLIMSSYAGTSDALHPGISVVINENGQLGLFMGRQNVSTLAYSSQFVSLSAFNSTKPMLLAVTLNGKTCTIKDLTNNLSNSGTLSSDYQRSHGPEIYVGKGPNGTYGNAAGKNRIASYMVFDRVLTDTELAEIHAYLLVAIQDRFPDITF